MTLSSSSHCSSAKYNVLPNWVNPQPKRKDPRLNISVKVPNLRFKYPFMGLLVSFSDSPNSVFGDW